jgi:hypothetical protein
MGKVKPMTNSASAGKRFMEVVYACSCIGVAAYGKIVIFYKRKTDHRLYVNLPKTRFCGHYGITSGLPVIRLPARAPRSGAFAALRKAPRFEGFPRWECGENSIQAIQVPQNNPK